MCSSLISSVFKRESVFIDRGMMKRLHVPAAAERGGSWGYSSVRSTLWEIDTPARAMLKKRSEVNEIIRIYSTSVSK